MSDPGPKLAFTQHEPEQVISTRTWIIAATAVLLAVIVIAFATLRHAPMETGSAQTPDRYAANLPFTNITMTEATNGAGGKSTYIDGTVTNRGTRTVTGALIQVTFTTADASVPYRETVPLALIRTREPYIDLEPVSATPLTPGQSREFRLIFETLPANWDVKQPEMQVIRADLR